MALGRWGSGNEYSVLSSKVIGHFRVAVNLIIKVRLSAKFLLGKLVFIHMLTKLIIT